MNIAQRILDHYETEDFEQDYFTLLLERFYDNKDEVIKRIEHIINIDYGNKLKNESTLNKIFDYIKDNLNDFAERFNNYYVGDNSLESISFGEQEEQLNYYNHRTKKQYTKKYLRKVFDDNFYINKQKNDDDLAYYDLSGEGLHINFKLTKEIKTIIENNEKCLLITYQTGNYLTFSQTFIEFLKPKNFKYIKAYLKRFDYMRLSYDNKSKCSFGGFYIMNNNTKRIIQACENLNYLIEMIIRYRNSIKTSNQLAKDFILNNKARNNF